MPYKQELLCIEIICLLFGSNKTEQYMVYRKISCFYVLVCEFRLVFMKNLGSNRVLKFQKKKTKPDRSLYGKEVYTHLKNAAVAAELISIDKCYLIIIIFVCASIIN